jgi:signal transduction histidine kinase
MAKQGKSYTIQWIRLMMISSQLLLMAFTANWLYNQYEKEKEQLNDDVRAVLKEVSRDISDSLLFSKYVSPLLGKSKDTSAWAELNHKGKGHTKMNTDIKITMNIGNGGTIQKHTERHITSPGNNDPIIIDINNKSGLAYVVSDTDEGVIKKVLPLLVKEITGDTFRVHINTNPMFTTDSLLVRHSFNERAQLNNWQFKTIWVHDTTGRDTRKALVISDNYFNQKGSLVLENYQWGLVKKITPQILFVCILLLLTGGSFVFAYRSLEKQMQLTAMKNDFISNMSHELKTPISTVKVALEALDNFNGLENPQTTRDYLQMAALEMNRLDMLVNKALSSTMLEEGRIILHKEKQDILQLIEDTLALLKYRFQQSNALVQTNFAEGDYIMNIDKMHMQGVLINILDNSLKYCDKQPGITISTNAGPGNVTIAIADNGPGIKQEYIKRVFDKFFRVPMGDTHNVKGYGLGLSYAKQIVALHGGTVDVHNRPEGGCIFTINLPKL